MSDICQVCGLPQELCVCESIAKENQEIKIYTIKKKFGKKNTVVEGIDTKQIDLKDLGKKLKNLLACGGTAKEGKIELQGDHKNKVRDELVRLGFPQNTIKIK
ncbi:translation initiation factor [archaeon]|jgi:translation initiation factor 1|nr:translation initiation factor [archaeon]MBT4272474.1 translation initiation factor [archaeon]MBT4460572.1 translation initiation factor [archaeon]MBT4857838.1 translation initiation factor [archaeon]MBT5423147.1 translation initiation factor [archaeon]